MMAMEITWYSQVKNFTLYNIKLLFLSQDALFRFSDF